MDNKFKAHLRIGRLNQKESAEEAELTMPSFVWLSIIFEEIALNIRGDVRSPGSLLHFIRDVILGVRVGRCCGSNRRRTIASSRLSLPASLWFETRKIRMAEMTRRAVYEAASSVTEAADAAGAVHVCQRGRLNATSQVLYSLERVRLNAASQEL